LLADLPISANSLLNCKQWLFEPQLFEHRPRKPTSRAAHQRNNALTSTNTKLAGGLPVSAGLSGKASKEINSFERVCGYRYLRYRAPVIAHQTTANKALTCDDVLLSETRHRFAGLFWKIGHSKRLVRKGR
jgi:hypothetical protein